MTIKIDQMCDSTYCKHPGIYTIRYWHNGYQTHLSCGRHLQRFVDAGAISFTKSCIVERTKNEVRT